MLTNQNPWHRRHDDPTQPIVPIPSERFYPDTRRDLIDIVNLALKNYEPTMTTPLPEVRGDGSHWALSTAAIPHDFFVETQNPEINPPNFSPPRLNRSLTDVIPSCLTQQAQNYLNSQEMAAGGFSASTTPEDVLFSLYHVEAGTRIYELYSRLDFPDRPLALQTMGGAGGQTIVGAFSTGTHGGDVLFPPLADCVMAIHLIAPALYIVDQPGLPRVAKAAEFWIERGDGPIPPLVDEGKLQAVYPKFPEEQEPITVIRDNDMFNAVLVGVGRMGIIYSVLLSVGWQYCLKQTRTKDSWNNVKSWINDPTNANFPQLGMPPNTYPADHRFVQVVVNPNGQPHKPGEHTCYVTFNDKMPVTMQPPGRDERRGALIPGSDPQEFQNAGNTAPYPPSNSGFFNLPCSSSSPVDNLIDQLTTDAVAAAVAAAATATALSASLSPLAAVAWVAAGVAAGTAAALITLKSILPGGPLGNAVGAICNWCAANNQFWIVRELEEFVLGSQQKPQTFTAISYAVLDTHDYTDIGCDVNIDLLEVCFDAAVVQPGGNQLLVDYVENIFKRIAELEAGAPWANNAPQAFVGYISLRYMSKSQGLIAMQRWLNTCSLEIAGFNMVGGTEPLLKQIERDALAMGGTVHWGQRNDLTMPSVEATYGAGANSNLDRWRSALSRFSGGGQLQSFSTAFTRQRGLEILQPTILNFSVTPATAPAGTLATVQWLAGDAPGLTLSGPGTTATLTISAGGQIIPLPAVNGSMAVPIPTGPSVFTLTLAYVFQGHLRTATNPVTVLGT